jgi:hypothetical protein
MLLNNNLGDERTEPMTTDSHLLGLTQPFIPSRLINRVPALTGVKAGLFASAGWQVTLCDPIRYATSRSCEMHRTLTAIHFLNYLRQLFYLFAKGYIES